MIYALDTNILIYLLNNDGVVMARKNKAVTDGARFIVPPVVDYELRRGLLYKPSPKKEGIYRAFVNRYGVGKMDIVSWELSADIYVKLRRKSLTVGDADIFISAFCIVNDYTLITGNTRHFEVIEELKIEDWTAE